jgi:carboxylesterase
VKTVVSRSNPARDYPEAMRRITALQERERPLLIPDARLQILTHGKRTGQAIVFLHGYTNCAGQFGELGKRFYALGYNVLIATQPHHGLPDRMTLEQARLAAEELAAFADEMADIAQGLGRQVVFAGLSGGGVMTAWIWMNRSDVGKSAIMAPAFGLKPIPWWLTDAAVNLSRILPNIYLWFDPVRKLQGTPEHTYPRFCTRALAEILRLGYAARRRADNGLPSAKELVVITNPNDLAVNNRLTKRIISRWRELRITAHEFDSSWKLDHDFIEPALPNQPVERTYPLLVEWITGIKS